MKDWKFVMLIGIIILTQCRFVLSHAIGTSMEPTLPSSSVVLIEKSNEVKRGDLVSFREPVKNGLMAIKRIVGLPGDVIKVVGGVILLKKGKRWEILAAEDPDDFPDYAACNKNMKEIKIKKGEVFVLGDNHILAEDSRFYGPVPVENIEGPVLGYISLIDFSGGWITASKKPLKTSLYLGMIPFIALNSSRNSPMLASWDERFDF